jgi:hypothetical protein
MRQSLAAAGAVAALLAGCGEQEPPTAAPTAKASSSAPATDAGGTEACRLAAEALDEGTLMSPGTIDEILTEGGLSTNPDLTAAIQSLAEAYVVARAAASTDESQTMDAVSTAAERVTATCDRAGLGGAG